MSKLRLLGYSAIAVTSLALAQLESYAFTGSASGFPVSESSDVTTITSGVTSSGMGFLNFIISMWQPILVIIVVGAVVAFVKSLRGSTKGAVHGR